MVWWKAVSNTATMGVPGMTSWQARMPIRLAGLCSGPRGMNSSMAASTSSLMMTDSENLLPPCSTRWPTAPISFMSLTTPFSGSVRKPSIRWQAFTWSGMGSTTSHTVLSSTFMLAWPSTPMPMRSTRPLARVDSSSMSMSWYFREEEPAFTIKIFIGIDSPFFHRIFHSHYTGKGRVLQGKYVGFCPFFLTIAFHSVFIHEIDQFSRRNDKRFNWKMLDISGHQIRSVVPFFHYDLIKRHILRIGERDTRL